LDQHKEINSKSVLKGRPSCHLHWNKLFGTERNGDLNSGLDLYIQLS